jgi:lipopolysaccharide export system permease protein
MTLSELRAASKQVEREGGLEGSRAVREMLVNYGVEIHKKLALAAACLVFAMLAIGIARHAPQAGPLLQIIASVSVFVGYYIAIMSGESLADRALVSPAVAMWGANVIAFAVAIIALRTARGRNRSDLLSSRVGAVS